MNNTSDELYCTAFLDTKAIASGSLQHVVTTVKQKVDDTSLAQLLVFNDSNGKMIDVDFRGNIDEVVGRLAESSPVSSTIETDQEPARRVGRPKLGVVSGEVTLLPRHWEWLKSQPGGASVTLRKLIDEARHAGEKQDTIRLSQEATYNFMTAMAGNFPQYEEALRALYAGDSERFGGIIDTWEPDITNHIKKLSHHAFLSIKGV